MKMIKSSHEPIIVLISGKAGSGKDTLAKYIEDWLPKDSNVLITHYADLVKYICEKFFRWDGKKDEKGRELLQLVGTDVVRKEDPEYWIKFLNNIFHMFPDMWDVIIIPDCRFPNEVTSMKKTWKNVLYVRTIREGYKSSLSKEAQNHISENAITDEDDYGDGYTITASSLPELYQGAKMIAGDVAEIMLEEFVITNQLN